MAKDKPKNDIDEKETKEAPVKETPKVEVKKEPKEKAAPVIPLPSEPAVSFDRWFRARSLLRGYKPHWADGMRAYADTTGRKTLSQWDKVFENY